MKRWIALLVVVMSLTIAHRQLCAESLGDVFKRVQHSVVQIDTSERKVATDGPARWINIGGSGSGFLIDDDGTIMTAEHVIHAVDEIEVVFASGETVPAVVIAAEPQIDVALIRAETVPVGAIAARLGDSDQVEVGDQVFIVGAPFGISQTMTVGHISARRGGNAVAGLTHPVELLQTDAAMNPGNSGGPMFNLEGEVVGVASHIVTESGGFDGLGFVVTSNLARKTLLEERSVWTGVDGHLLQGRLAMALNLPRPAGILIMRVAQGSPAEAFGLKPGTVRGTIEGVELTLGGDIVLEVQGIPIDGSGEIYARIREALAGLEEGSLEATVFRQGRIVTLGGSAD